MHDPQSTAGYAVNTSIDAGRFYNHRPRQNKYKTLPYADIVEQYFQKHPYEYLEIHCGPRAYRMAELDANQLRVFGDCKPSLYVPEYDDFESYWWPVINLKIVLRWHYGDQTLLQIKFCNYLAKACKAECVWTLLDGELTKFADLRRLM